VDVHESPNSCGSLGDITGGRPVLVLQRVLPDYRVPIFRALAKAVPSVQVLFGQPQNAESIQNFSGDLEELFIRARNWYLPRRSSPYFTGFLPTLRRHTVVVVNHEIGNLNTLILVALRHLLDLRLVLWSFGYDPVRGFHPKSRMKDRFRLYLYDRADSVLFYWENGQRAVMPFLARPGNCFVAPNTLDTDALAQILHDFEAEGRTSVRAKIGIGPEPHFVFVGRLVPDKQVDFLLRAFELAHRDLPAMRLTIVGSGPEESRLRLLCDDRRLDAVRFVGRVTDPVEVGRYLYACDAMTMPGRLGLSVVHSFAFGAPVISLAKPFDFHGEGIGYLKHGQNGLLAPDDDERRYADALLQIARDPVLRQTLSLAAQSTVRVDASIHAMIAGMADAIRHAARSDD